MQEQTLQGFQEHNNITPEGEAQENYSQYKNPSFRNFVQPIKKATEKQIINRRYNKMVELRQNGFFTEQSIKLRQPLLYHIYIGQYSQKTSSNQKPLLSQTEANNQLLSQFLSKDLLNIQYKNLLKQEIHTVELQEYIQSQTKQNQKQIKQLQKLNQNFKKIKEPVQNSQIQQTNASMEIEYIEEQLKQIYEEEEEYQIKDVREHASQKLKNQQNSNSYLTSKDYSHLQSQPVYLTYQQMSLQQQALIQQCEILFLKGQQKQLDYSKIDNNQSYDNIQEMNKDSQQNYFSQEQEYIENGYQNYYTGVQDY